MVYKEASQKESWNTNLTRPRTQVSNVVKVTAKDLERVQLLKDSPDRERIRQKLQDEKIKLHQKSVERAKSWSKTVEGERAKRLEAMAEKERQLEEERKMEDEEWRAIKEAERQHSINKAKQIIYYRNPVVRDFHSAALLCNVMRERDLQVLHRQKRKEKIREMEQNQEKVDRRQWLISELKEREAKAQKRMEKLNLGEEQRMTILDRTHKREIEGKQAQTTDPIWDRFFRPAETAAEVEEREQCKRNALRADLAATIVSKHESELIEKKFEQCLEFECEQFTQFKDNITKKRNEVERRNIVERQRITAEVEKMHHDLNNEMVEQKQKFINKQANSRTLESYFYEREERRAQERANDQKDVMEELAKTKTEKANAKKKIVQEDREWLKKLKEEAMSEAREKSKKLESARKAAAEDFKTNLKITDEKRQLGSQLKQSKIALESEDKLKDDLELSKFQDYAHELLEHIGSDQRSQILIRKVLERNEVVKKPRPHCDPTNSFARLGFIRPENYATLQTES